MYTGTVRSPRRAVKTVPAGGALCRAGFQRAPCPHAPSLAALPVAASVPSTSPRARLPSTLTLPPPTVSSQLLLSPSPLSLSSLSRFASPLSTKQATPIPSLSFQSLVNLNKPPLRSSPRTYVVTNAVFDSFLSLSSFRPHQRGAFEPFRSTGTRHVKALLSLFSDVPLSQDHDHDTNPDSDHHARSLSPLIIALRTKNHVSPDEYSPSA
ncbi:hypothetical protein G7046_g1603 [Stylonectria norvegica]|nr:hypothetical protein G7046_g1603 [Stylonectria norvegica]